MTYLLYGLTDAATIGLIPRFGYNNPGQRSSVGVGDMTAQVSYRLSRFLDQGWLPAMALVVAETFPTGKYDRLSDPNDGIGAGSYTTALALYGQYYLWMPDGRILRTRINLSETGLGTSVSRTRACTGRRKVFVAVPSRVTLSPLIRHGNTV